MSLAVATRPHPQWLYEGLVSGNLPWHQAQPYTYAQFSEKYTLHDSLWVGLFPDVGYPGDTVLCLSWDSLWLPEAIITQLFSDSSLYLLMKLTGTMGVTFSDGANANQANGLAAFDEARMVSPAATRRIESTELVELDDNSVLLVTDTQGRSVTLVFEGTIHFLAIDNQQRLIPL